MFKLPPPKKKDKYVQTIRRLWRDSICPAIIPSFDGGEVDMLLLDIRGKLTTITSSFLFPWCTLCMYNEDKPGFTCNVYVGKAAKDFTCPL